LSSEEEQDNKQNSNNEIEAKLIGADSQTDLALLKIEKNDLPFIPFADSDNARIGDIVFAIGNPFGIGQTVTMGIISAKRKENLGVTPYDYFIQTDAAINPGNSGGALIDSEGNLIGISTALFSKSGGYQGIGLAVPSNTAQRIADSLKQNGKVKRPYLGISVIDLNEDINPITIEFLNKGYKEGALVLKVQPGGKADSVGIKPGTLVNNINGKQIKSSEELIRFALKLKEDEEVKLKADVLDLQKGNITKKEFSFIPEVK
jgi:serine protease Do